ncbi:hypothetical protein FQN54_004488 [Arachnomyces sp. PD_36]|nr:hypothetical protein FQN54_004488 [Arachnomyces sp. PD_36]
MLLPVALLTLIPLARAVSLPQPSGPYGVGFTQQVFNHTTLDDPTDPHGTGKFFLMSLYYPTLSHPSESNAVPYFDPISAQIWSDALEFPNGTLESLETELQLDAPFLPGKVGENPLPTVVFSPGGGVNGFMNYALVADLASYGYTVAVLDHAGEPPYLQLPDGSGVVGLSIYLTYNASMIDSMYSFRVGDAKTFLQRFPAWVEENSAPVNTSNYIAMGHSIGGATAAGLMENDPSIVGGFNLDGAFVDADINVERPFLMMSSINHTAQMDPSWSIFPEKQTGWWEDLNVYGSGHLDYCDVGLWPPVLGLTGTTATPQIGPIGGFRMFEIIRAYTQDFFRLLGGQESTVLNGPSLKWREVIYVNGSSFM